MGLRDANVVIGAIYGETGRHQDLGPGGQPILSERMRVNGKVSLSLSFLFLSLASLVSHLPLPPPRHASINQRNQKL